jgi:hypothetical protein
MATAVVGLRVKTGRALAVVIAGTRLAPIALSREEVWLADRAQPNTMFPYHLELEGQPKAAEAAAKVARQVGARALRQLFQSVASPQKLKSVVVVVNTHTPPERIHSPHMRAHSREGWLFREICENAAEQFGIEPITLACDEVPGAERATQKALTLLGAEFGRPWTADWKLATAAAWLQLPER